MRREEAHAELGTAEILPDRPVEADRYGLWQIRYMCGTKRVEPGCCVRVTIPYGFTPAQTAYPSAEGFTWRGAAIPV